MEGNDYLTSGDLALMDNYRRNDCGYNYGRRDNIATTGVGLAAGLGGGALLLAIAGIWGANQASKARATGNSNALNTLSNIVLSERNSRESWQNRHAPSISQYVDVQAGATAGANACSNAFAVAQNQIVADALTGRSQLCPSPVTLYSAPSPCPCPSGSCGCGM